ncbi:MAG: hypothetical protein GX749_01170 [Ruminococcaceae bacterium]|nr:hypothetical protein [Oscillospiraceae bacterium]
MKTNQQVMHQFERDSARESRGMKLQDVFLNYCRREKVEVTIQLLDRTSRNGQIVGFDYTSIILEAEGRQYLLYKTAIVAVNPKQAVNYIFNDNYRGDNRVELSKGRPEYATYLA